MATTATCYHPVPRGSHMDQQHSHYHHDNGQTRQRSHSQSHNVYLFHTRPQNTQQPHRVLTPDATGAGEVGQKHPSVSHRRSLSDLSEPLQRPSPHARSTSPLMLPSRSWASSSKDILVREDTYLQHSHPRQHHRPSLSPYPPLHHPQAQPQGPKENFPQYHRLYQHTHQQVHSSTLDRYYCREEQAQPRRASKASSISSASPVPSPSFSFSSASSVTYSSSPSPKSLPMPLSETPALPLPPIIRPGSRSRSDESSLQEMPLQVVSKIGDDHRDLTYTYPRLSSAVAKNANTLLSRTNTLSSSATDLDANGYPQGIEHDRYDDSDRSDASFSMKESTSPGRLGKHAVSVQPYPCPEQGCRTTCESVESLSRHRLKHIHVKTGDKYHCTWPKCDKLLATQKSLKDHLQIHAEREAGIRLYCPVENCGKVFGTHRCLRAHELRCKQVKSGARLPCPFENCKATFGSSDYVRRHVLDHEKGLIGIEFRCDYAGCEAILANTLTLQRHKQLHEEQSLGFEWRCLVRGCGKVYSGSKQLTDHQARIHKDLDVGYRFLCPYNACREVFECQRSAYKHGCLYKKKQCPIEGCTCLLPSEEALNDHIWMHNTLKTRPPYPCFEEGCSKVFDTKQGILAHALTHIAPI